MRFRQVRVPYGSACAGKTQRRQTMTREQWLAIQRKDASWDGKLYYAIKPGKTVCRPSCTARSCEPEDVVVFDNLEEALRRGYRPCPRCRPDRPDWRGSKQKLTECARTYLETHYQEKFSLDGLASALFVNKVYLSKVFKQQEGVTLLSYHHRFRCERACTLLRDTDWSVEAIGCYVGYATASHFARVFRSFCGCSPSAYRKGYLRSLKEGQTGEEEP